MASINFGPFDNWFKKPPNPFPPINLISLSGSLNPFKPQTQSNPFASISTSTSPQPDPEVEKKPGKYRQMLDQFYWEAENRPDYRHAPEIDAMMNEDPVFEKKENPTPEEIEENEKLWEELRNNPVVEFLLQAEKIADKINEIELRENSIPYHKEDKKYWNEVPNVIGLDGRPMPRKAFKTQKEADDKFWDFARQFFFGLWGFRQRPYPPGRPIDVSQAIGYKRLEKRYYDCEFSRFNSNLIAAYLLVLVI